MKTIIIDSDRQKLYCKNLIDEMPIDGSQTVTTKKTDMSPTGKQRRLQWKWYTEVAQSGLGQNDTKDGVHLTAKWQFARPILLRDDEVFGVVFEYFMKAVEQSKNKSAYLKEFTRDYISTERMNKHQRAEFLTDFQNFWIRKGVDLTDPNLHGVDLKKWGMK